MITSIKEHDGSKTIIATHEYSIGTYVIINYDSSQQFGIDIPEKEYHNKIRTNAIKRGAEVLPDSTPLN